MRVTGKGGSDDGLVLNSDEVKEITSEGFISDNAIDACLLLLEKKLYEKETYRDISVYSISQCRLILNGYSGHIGNDRFMTIIPKNLVMDDYRLYKDAKEKGKSRSDFGGFHFTLVTNLHCNKGEVNIFQTLEYYRSPSMLLNEEEKRLLKLLCKCGSNPLKVKAMKVPLQKENECGPLAFELAQKFCFYHDEGRLNSKVNNSRKHLLSCLKADKIIDLQLEFEGEPENDSVLFSYYI